MRDDIKKYVSQMQKKGFMIRRIPSVDIEVLDKEKMRQNQDKLKRVIKDVSEYFQNVPYRHSSNLRYGCSFNEELMIRHSGSPAVRTVNRF